MLRGRKIREEKSLKNIHIETHKQILQTFIIMTITEKTDEPSQYSYHTESEGLFVSNLRQK